jgi:hypothetical protein
MNRHASLLELSTSSPSELVGPEEREEEHRVRELRQLCRRNGASAAGLFPRVGRSGYLTRARDSLHREELDPLHVTHDGDAHDRHAHRSARSRVSRG